MAINTGTVTLADYALTSNQPLVQAVTYSLILYSNVLQDVPLTDRKSLIANGARFEGNLPTVNWSQLNAEGVTTKGTPTAYQEQVYILRNYIDVDKFIVEDMNQIVEPRAVQAEAFLKAFTYDFNYKFFKNDHVTGDVNAPVGLRYRIANGGTFGVRPENLIDAGGLDLTQATLLTTPGNGNKLIEFLDQLLWSVDSPTGDGVTLYMNEVMRRRFTFAVRALGTSGGFDITQDQFGRTIEKYKNATIRDPGYKQDQATRIILGPSAAGLTGQFGETAAGADGTSTSTPLYTSVYAVNYGMDHFSGWQFNPINVQDLGLIYNGAIYRTLIDWAIGFINASTRSIGRLYDIKLA
jgi:hypothetical protein